MVVLAGLPTLTIVAGLLSGGSFHSQRLGSSLLNQGLQILLAAIVINIWEEAAWAGFFRTRLEARHNIVVAVVVFTDGLAWVARDRDPERLKSVRRAHHATVSPASLRHSPQPQRSPQRLQPQSVLARAHR